MHSTSLEALLGDGGFDLSLGGKLRWLWGVWGGYAWCGNYVRLTLGLHVWFRVDEAPIMFTFTLGSYGS